VTAYDMQAADIDGFIDAIATHATHAAR